MIHNICGLQDSGKTLYMTYLGLMDLFKGNQIISNYDLNYPHRKINRDFLIYIIENGIRFMNVSWLMDEFWLWADARKSEAILSYFYLQTSKDNANFYTTAQGNNQNDSRLRNNANKITVCNRALLLDNKFKNYISDKRDIPLNILPKTYIKCKQYKLTQIGMDVCQTFSHTDHIKIKTIGQLYNTREKIKAKI